MLKMLLKKQFFEWGRTFFYDEKKKKSRSKGATIAYIALYVLLIVGLLGGMFTVFANSLCLPLYAAGVGWLYFVITGLLGIALGTFGSVFNTFATLYTAKDNDLLLSMPIPEKYIVISRLSTVYILGTLFATVATLPAVIIHLVQVKCSALSVIGGILFMLVVSLIVLVLSCLLGYFVAKISVKLKNKSFITVAASLLFFGVYYFISFKSNEIIQNIIANAAEIGEKIEGSAYFLCFFGKMGEGNAVSFAVCTLVSLAAAVLTCAMIARSFRKIATASHAQSKAKRRADDIKTSGVGAALFGKEMKRFTSSPNYMLNCGFGVVFIAAAAVFLAVKPDMLLELFEDALGFDRSATVLFTSLILCLLSTMNDSATASVSLEGKSIWVLQSLPVDAKKVLHAKMAVQLVITCVPLLICSVVAAIVLRAGAAAFILMIILPQTFAFITACFDLIVNIRNPILDWTNEIVPLKQSMSVVVALLVSFLYTAAFSVGGYFAVRVIAPEIFMVAFSAVNCVVSVFLLKWINTKGARIYSEL